MVEASEARDEQAKAGCESSGVKRNRTQEPALAPLREVDKNPRKRGEKTEPISGQTKPPDVPGRNRAGRFALGFAVPGDLPSPGKPKERIALTNQLGSKVASAT